MEPSQPARPVLAPARHPGRVLLEDFLLTAGISQNELARLMQVSPRRVNEIVLGKRSITADSAIRLSEALGMSGQYWMALQAEYDLERVHERRGTLGLARNADQGNPKGRYDGPRYGNQSPAGLRKPRP